MSKIKDAMVMKGFEEENEKLRTFLADMALFVASMQIAHRFNKEDNEWVNRVLKLYNDFRSEELKK